ncbi:high frequency lysogenization protein HflD [Reinekea marinisedimentorum]|uniref:High frequency lysogenization protein HflD homolog n=1 Tax=Reinekea marinisedimentorum TaxID=230495 RepID=A0A4R3I8L8_9GAMM|nr:high frequency lysogenization protein HflD [Reinekea marinisedimentorum]TCS42474.1 high frequency lysogenization protein [Reinekea marinisedimentorum]
MDSTINRQTLALAGVFQAAKLVDRLAKSGMIELQQIESTIESILNLNPSSYEDVFKGTENVAIGLNTLKEAMAKNGRGVNREVLQYAMGIIAVQNKLQKRPDLMEALSNSLDRTVDQQKYFGSFSHEAVIASAAQCYESSVSKLSFRIRVTGNPSHLQNPKVAEKIRTILLFGVRCAMLWRQAGGHRWHFLTSRKAIKDCADGLLSVV